MRIQAVLEVTEDIFRDFDNKLLINKFDELIGAIEAYSNTPNADTQLKVGEVRDQVYADLENSRFNDYPPSLELILEEMGVRGWLGLELKKKIEAAFIGNDLTPASAGKQIKDIRERVHRIWNQAEQLGISAKEFDLRRDENEFNEYDFTIVIPRTFVDNELDNFGVELKKFPFIPLTHV